MSQPFDKYEKLGAYHWDWYDDSNWAWYKECVDRCVGFCKGATYDIGGGDGVVAKKIADNGYATMVLDNNDGAAQLCRDKNINYGDIDIDKDSFLNRNMKPDYIACLNVIEHLKNIEGIKNVIRNNVTKGAIIITDKATDSPGRYHEHEYTKKELLDTFKEFKPKYFEINSTEFGKPITFIGVEIRK